MTDILKNAACAAALTTACIGFIWSQTTPDSTTLPQRDRVKPSATQAGQVDPVAPFNKSQDTKSLVEHSLLQNWFRARIGQTRYHLGAQ